MTETPENLKYTKEHVWLKIEDEIVTIGVTDYAQQQLKDIVFIEFPEKGKSIKKGDNFTNIESVKSVSEVVCPISCEVIELNNKLTDSPDIINQDCYGEGWIAKIKLENKEETNNLISAEEYKNSLSA